MIDTLIMMAALVAAIIWIVFQQWRANITFRLLTKSNKRLRSAKLTLAATKETNEALVAENEFLKTVIRDVAMGDAHVWVGEDGEVRAARATAGNTSIH
jgi:cell division protein FtsB